MESSPLLAGGSALLAGALFGYCAQRGGFCLTRALSNLVLAGDGTVARAYLLALLVAIVGTHLLILGPLDALPVRPFRWVASLVGGFVFGIGMILGGSCAGSAWYRVGEGALGAAVVVLGFSLGATATSVGALAPLRQRLQVYELLAGEEPATLYLLVGLGPWPVIGGVILLAGLWLARGGDEPRSEKWPWTVLGAAMGLVIVLGWYLSSLGDAPIGITFATNTSHLLTYPLVNFPSRVTWGMLLVVGVPAGSAVAAWRTDQFGWKAPPGFVSVRLFVGGALMGIGALIADGCNITQGLTQGATLSLAGLTAFAAMLAGGALTLWAMLRRSAEPPVP